VLDRVLGAWLYTRAVRAAARLVIAIDAKTIRGAKGKDGKAPHLVAALAHGIGRRARRTVKMVLAPSWIEFDGAAQVAQLRRTVTKKGDGRALLRIRNKALTVGNSGFRRCRCPRWLRSPGAR